MDNSLNNLGLSLVAEAKITERLIQFIAQIPDDTYPPGLMEYILEVEHYPLWLGARRDWERRHE